MNKTLLIELTEICRKHGLTPEVAEALAKDSVAVVESNLHCNDPESLQAEIQALTGVINLLQQDLERLLERAQRDNATLSSNETRLAHIRQTVEDFFTAQLDSRPRLD